MFGAAALLLALAFQGSAGAVAQSPAPAAEATVMIVEFPRGARFIGFPRRCPGSTEDDPDEGTCLAELYEGRAIVVRHLSGPRVGRRARLRLTAHARNWRPGTRMLVATWPFNDQGTTGNFAFWWEVPEANGDYCMTTENLSDWGDNPVTRQFARGYRLRFQPWGYSERAEFRCIRGWRQSVPSR